uniref:Cytochrome P450 n=1 Tax=Valeriana officinalis TaxID=19953 RepID=A0A141LLV4_VALOF|nr:cytochrome P450 [Valeriana officinalis]AVX32612.1 cytochrome P450 VoCYP71D442 [Valeriana officinalis]
MDLLMLSFISIIFLFLLLKFVRKLSSPRNLPPGPPKLPLVGSLLHMSGLPHHTMKNLASKYGPLMHVQLGQVSAVVISSPEVAKQVLNIHDVAFASRPSILATRIITYNHQDFAFAPYGSYWRQMRKMATLELLSSKKVRSFSTIRDEEVHNMVESVHYSSLGSKSVNLTEKIFAVISSIVGRSLLGDKCKDQDAFVKLINDVINLGSGFDLVDLFPSFTFLNLVTGNKAKLEKMHKSLDKIFDRIIEDHILKKENAATGQIGTEDLVDVLLRLKENDGFEFPITNINIKAVILDLFMAGTDSSSATIEWAMSELIRHPRVMEKAQAELRRTLKGKKVIEDSDRKDFHYLKLVIKEVLRMHPPVAFLLPRECIEETQINGYTIPIKTKVLVNVWAMGRDPQHWKDPDSFYPERFENCVGYDFSGSNYEYLPFGAGRRSCPGITFGLADVEHPLAGLLYHFNWSLPDGIKSENINMAEIFGASVKRRDALRVIAKRQTFSV